MLNQCVLTGNLGADPEVFYSSEGNRLILLSYFQTSFFLIFKTILVIFSDIPIIKHKGLGETMIRSSLVITFVILSIGPVAAIVAGIRRKIKKKRQ